MIVLRLAVPTPLRRLFDYLPPPGMSPSQAASLRPGVRLRVPFGRRVVTGYLVEVATGSEAPPERLRPASELLDTEPLIGPALGELAQWAASYYHHPPGEVYSALFPKRLRDGAAHRGLGESAWRITDRGRGLPPGAPVRSPRQAAALDLLRGPGTLPAQQLAGADISAAVLRALRDKGLVEACTMSPQARPAVCRESLTLNSEQSAVVAAMLKAREGFSCHLLEGVTGSGKTEVYLQLIADCLRRGRQALVLIPEIGLTPQTLGRFRARFDADIAVLHSGLGEAERYRAWEAARTGRAAIVIGTRSAVFTPLARPGLIVVDEEHDASYKQQDGFRYSARDVAVKRAQLEQCPVLLGSATPSLESIHNALAGRYGHHRLRHRAGAADLPAIDVLDIRSQPLSGGLSPALLESLESCLSDGRQALLFLNRRGYAPTLQCHDCGWVAECEACDARLTVHRRRGLLRCHHCGAAHSLYRACPRCHSRELVTTGIGTEQAEGFLCTHFGEHRVFRVDSDSMQGRNSMAALVERTNRGEPCILLGTQMLTKGHHFPGVSLVGVLDADALLFSADFRGEERMAQLLTQVAGRAGRDGAPARVFVQSRYPDHPLLQSTVNSDYAEQARALLQARRASGMPPLGHLVLLHTDCADAQAAEGFLQAVRDAAGATLSAGAHLIGPLPAPLQRRANRYRCQLLLSAPNRRQAQAGASLLVAEAERLPARRGLRWSIDVDPQDLF